MRPRLSVGVFSPKFKRSVAREFPNDRADLHELVRRHNLARNLIQVPIRTYETRELADELTEAEYIASTSARRLRSSATSSS